MFICPNCNHTLEYASVSYEVTRYQSYYPGSGDYDNDGDDEDSDGHNYSYTCPECSAFLTLDQLDRLAREFDSEDNEVEVEVDDPEVRQPRRNPPNFVPLTNSNPFAGIPTFMPGSQSSNRNNENNLLAKRAVNPNLNEIPSEVQARYSNKEVRLCDNCGRKIITPEDINYLANLLCEDCGGKFELI